MRKLHVTCWLTSFFLFILSLVCAGNPYGRVIIHYHHHIYLLLSYQQTVDPFPWTDANSQKRVNLCFYSVVRMERCFHCPQADADWSEVLITASICCAFSLRFSPPPPSSSSFYCELLSLLCVIFPIHTQAISMSHSKCSLLQSRPKYYYRQTPCLWFSHQ